MTRQKESLIPRPIPIDCPVHGTQPKSVFFAQRDWCIECLKFQAGETHGN